MLILINRPHFGDSNLESITLTANQGKSYIIAKYVRFMLKEAKPNQSKNKKQTNQKQICKLYAYYAHHY